MRLKQKIVTILGLITACLFCAQPSPGYIPIGEHILDLMVSHLGNTRGFYVTHATVTGVSGCVASANNGIEGKSWFKLPGMFRSEWSTGESKSKKIYVSSPEGALTIVGNKIVATGESDLMLYKEPLLFRDRNELVARLTNGLGIDASVSSLGRMDDKVAYVVGANYPDLSVSQLWVDKKNFLPLRLLVKQNNNGSTIEARYFKWRKTGRVWFPMRIEVYRDNQPIYTICSRDVREKGSFGSRFFDINSMKQSYRTAEDPYGEKAHKKKNKDDEIQETIEDFKKLYGK